MDTRSANNNRRMRRLTCACTHHATPPRTLTDDAMQPLENQSAKNSMGRKGERNNVSSIVICLQVNCVNSIKVRTKARNDLKNKFRCHAVNLMFCFLSGRPLAVCLCGLSLSTNCNCQVRVDLVCDREF